MEITALILLIILCIIGFIMVFFTSFGNLVIFIAALIYAFMTHFNIFNIKIMVILFLLYIFGESLEYLCVVIGAKKFGASKWSIAGSIIGGIIGAIIGLFFMGIGIFFGTLIGIFLGAFIPEYIIRKNFKESFKAGVGGILGRLSSIVGKAFIAIIMLIIMAAKIIIYY